MTGPYGKWIGDYRDSGLHPFPADGKRPCVRGFADRRPSASALDRWTETFPQANLGFPTARQGLAVLDADDPDVVALFEAVAGDTPLKVRTRQGEHWYFADPSGAVASVNHPHGQPFDIKAAGRGAFVLAPGSENGGAVYRLVDEDEVSIPEFARRLASLPRLEPAAVRELLRQPQGLVQVRNPLARRSDTVILTGAPIPEGARNSTLFRAALRDAHGVLRQFGDTADGQSALADRIQAYNAALCVSPLPPAEVNTLAKSAWDRTISGANRPPARHRRHVRDALRRMGRQVRGLALWGWLSQSGLDTDDIELAPTRVSTAIPGWKRHDAEAAIAALVRAGVLRVLQAGGKGRGNVARYRLTEPLASDVSFSIALHRLKGDAAAVMLLVFIVDVWGSASVAPVSAEGMSQSVGGPFGGWTRVKIVRARDHLAEAGLIERLQVRRTSVRYPRALFQVRAADVLKMPGNVPVDIHRPPGLVALAGPSRQDLQASPGPALGGRN